MTSSGLELFACTSLDDLTQRFDTLIIAGGRGRDSRNATVMLAEQLAETFGKDTRSRDSDEH